MRWRPTRRIAASALAISAAVALGSASAALASTPIQLDQSNPHYVVFHGRPTILVSSGEHYGAIMNEAWSSDDGRTYLDTLHEDGLNATRLFSGAYREHPSSLQGGGGLTSLPPNTLGPRSEEFLTPWARSNTPGYAEGDPEVGGGNKFDLSRWDPAYFHKLKEFVRYADHLGIAVEYTFFSGIGGAQWDASPMNAANNVNGVGNIEGASFDTLENDGLLEYQEELERKVAKELRPYDNVYYEVINEPFLRSSPTVYEAWQERLTDALAETEAQRPHPHLIAWNVSGENALAGGAPNSLPTNSNVSILNLHTAAPSDVAHNYGAERMIGDDEIDFEGPYDSTYRTQAWEFIVGGGGEYNNLDFSFTPDDPTGRIRPEAFPGGWVWDGGPVLRQELGVLSKLVNSLPFTEMRPGDDVIAAGPTEGQAHALVQDGQLYLVYVNALPIDYLRYFLPFRQGQPNPGELTAAPHTDTVTISAPKGHYLVRWLDPASGGLLASQSVNDTSGSMSLTSPQFSADAAVLITRH